MARFGDFFIRESTFRADGEDHDGTICQKFVCQRDSAWIQMSDESTMHCQFAGHEIIPIRDRRQIEQMISSRLFASGDHGLPQFVELAVAWIHDTARGDKRDQSSDSQFGRFLDQPVESISLGNGCADDDLVWRLLFLSSALNLQFHITFADSCDFRLSNEAGSIEQFGLIARPGPEDMNQVMRLDAIQKGAS